MEHWLHSTGFTSPVDVMVVPGVCGNNGSGMPQQEQPRAIISPSEESKLPTDKKAGE